MSDPALEVVEFLLTARVFTDDRALDANDLPPRYRRVFWTDASDDDDSDANATSSSGSGSGSGSSSGSAGSDAGSGSGSGSGSGPGSAAARSRAADGEFDPPGGIERPLVVTETVARKATGVEHPWEAVSDLLFTQKEEFAGRMSITQPDMALEWFLDRADPDRLETNPTLASAAEGRPGVEVTREAARERTRPIHADRVWIDALLDQYFDDGEDGDADMLDLVQIRAPEEIELTLDDIVLTGNQEEEIRKIVTAIEHRDYLAEIGLREIGKLLFVGPPGTGKTTISRGLAHELGLPLVEVKLSMVTSQYLGETAKNVERTFEVAKRLSPCILFIDEFDSVAKTRRSDEHAALKRAVNTLLKSIDDISLVRDEVLLIGATNHPDQLDAAAWRRFDEIVNFPKPDRGMRADILTVITKRMDIAEFDPAEIAERTEGLTGSDLRLVMREAVLEALTDGRRTLTQADVMAAVEDFEERDNLKNMDMIDGDTLANGRSAEADADDADDAADAGHDHEHDHGSDADHGHDHDHDHGSDADRDSGHPEQTH